MPREFAPVPLRLWGEDAFRALTPAAQHLYLLLDTSPAISRAGVVDWRPRRIAALAAGWTAEAVEAAADELVDALWIVVDADTEEVLVIGHMDHDGILKQPNMATAMVTAHAGIASTALRGVVVHELNELYKEQPEAKGWASPTARDLLARSSIDPSTYPCRKGSRKGSPDGSSDPSINPPVNGFGRGHPTPSVEGWPITSTSTSTLHNHDVLTVVCRLTTGNDQAEATDDDIARWAETAGPHADLQVEARAFLDHNATTDVRSWSAAWRGWLQAAAKRTKPTPTPGTPTCPVHPGRPTGSRACPDCATELSPSPGLRTLRGA